MTAPKICPTCDAEYPANERFCTQDGTALRLRGGAAGDLTGSIVADRYHVVRKLGEGGMGTVYLAEHVKMGRRSAVKVMNPGTGHDADAISRFNREAANASRISHPNVAAIYDFGETPEGLIYLAMEYVEGEPLSALVQAHGALPPRRAAEITRQVAAALTAAHDLGIVHRDLKPDNIMIAKGRDGSDLVKVVDFGIAKATRADAQKVTRTGLVVGTPEYMSPEQLSGGELDGRSDEYSLALVAFHMLSGRTPFPSDSAQESMIMRLTDEPKSLVDMKPDVRWPAAVQAVMDRGLAREAGRRYATAAEFGEALRDAVREMPAPAEETAGTLVVGAATAAVPPTRLSPPAAAAGRTPVKVGRGMPMLIGGGLLAAVALAGVVLAGRRNAAPASPAGPVAARADSVSGAPAAPPAGAPRTGAQAAVARTQPAASFGAPLRALLESVTDSASARHAERELDAYRSRVSTPADRAAISLVAAKAALLTSGADRGCSILKRIDSAALTGAMKKELVDGLQLCEGT